MSTRPTPRVRVPATAKAGEIIEIKTLISHEMESGQRRDQAGAVIPRRIINKFTMAFNGKVIFEADWHPSVSANPYQAVFFKATETGDLTFTWKDDNGDSYVNISRITVS